MTSKGLTPGQRRLVEAMRRLGFGRIENLIVQHGEPVFDVGTRVRRERKFGSSDSPPRTSNAPHEALKAEVVELLDELALIGDGIVDAIDVRHGLPFRLITSHTPQPEGSAS